MAFIDSSGLESQTISYFPNNSGQKFTEYQLTIGNTQNSPVDSESYTVTVQNSIVCVIPQQVELLDFNREVQVVVQMYKPHPTVKIGWYIIIFS